MLYVVSRRRIYFIFCYLNLSKGFANFGSMGIALATLGVFAPTRKKILVSIAPRALIGGNMVSLMTASIAGNDLPFLDILIFFFSRSIV